MEIYEYLAIMREIQKVLLEYIDNEDNIQENFNKFIKLLKDQKIQDDKHKLADVIKLISNIINYHYRTTNFFDKIFNIIIFLKDDIQKYYTSREVTNFLSNKKVLLFLFREKIISCTKSIASNLIDNYNYELSGTGLYLYPEIKEYVDEYYVRFLKIPENLEELRESEYGDNHFLQLIQNDLIDEFIYYINTNEFNLDDKIESSSIFETNPLITQLNIRTAIEYATFFGSIKIFKYLLAEKCNLNPNLFLCAIHGRNPEIIHILEDNFKETEKEPYSKYLSIAIKCHHNELSDYIINNYMESEDVEDLIFEKSLQYFNYNLIQTEKVNSKSFYEICICGHYNLAKYLLDRDESIDINARTARDMKEKWSQKIMKTQNTALYNAIKLGNIGIVQLLLEKKDIDVNKKSIEDCDYHNEITPLFIAAYQGESEIVQFLLNHKGIDVNMKSKNGRELVAPINAAIEKDNDEIVQLLLSHKDIDVNIRSLKFDEDCDECIFEFYREVTPLYQAAGFCYNPKIVQLLIDQKNIDINAIINIRVEQYCYHSGEIFELQYLEESALYAAVNNNIIENIKILLNQENIDVNFKSKLYCYDQLYSKSISVLERAVIKENIEIIELLLKHKNIDVNITDKQGRKPIELTNNEKIISLFNQLT